MDRALGWLACGLLLAVFAATTVFGVYDFAPRRVWIVGAGAAAAVAVAILAARGARGLEVPWPRVAFVVFLAVAASGNLKWAPLPHLKPFYFITTLLGPVLLAAATFTLDRRGKRVSLALAWLALAALAYGVIIVENPRPAIDVLDHLRRAGASLLAGDNPYATPIPDFYKGRYWYGSPAPGFPYPPAPLAAATLASALHVDVRWVLLAALLGGGVLARQTARRCGASPGLADLVLALWLFVPRAVFVINYSHTEPVSGLLLAAGIYLLAAGRAPPGLVLLGAFASSKQYLAVAAPLLLLFARTPRAILWLGLGAVAPWIPFVLWDPGALWNAAFAYHLSRPIRHDSLNLNSWLYHHGSRMLSPLVSLAGGVTVGVLAGLRRSGLPLLCLGLACCLLVTLFLGPQAFANYYLLVAWCLVLALATGLGRVSRSREASLRADRRHKEGPEGLRPSPS